MQPPSPVQEFTTTMKYLHHKNITLKVHPKMGFLSCKLNEMTELL